MRQHAGPVWAGRVAGAVVTALALLLAASPAAAQSSWEVIAERRGVVVSQRQGNNDQFPTFRGVGMVSASLTDVFAVIHDVRRHTEWMFRCADSRLLEQRSLTKAVMYNRTDAPWPVWDRDVVVETSISVEGAGLLISFQSTKSHPPVAPVEAVRMNNFSGHYKLTVAGPSQTEVEYVVTADPGGRLPDWLVRAATRRLPLETIERLRLQVSKTRGANSDRILSLRPLLQALNL